jgi:hypothetical protein
MSKLGGIFMKKILALLLVLSLAFSFVAYGGDKKSDDAEETEKKTTEKVENTEPSTEPVTEPEKVEPKVDLTALSAVEKQDTFPVSIKEVKFAPGANDDGSNVVSLDGEDAVVVTLANNTGVTITSITVFFLCTDKDGKTTIPGGLASAPIIGDLPCSKNLMTVTWGSQNLKTGTELVGGIRCNLNRFENMNLIVYSYTDSNGKEVINENIYNWLPLTLEK